MATETVTTQAEKGKGILYLNVDREPVTLEHLEKKVWSIAQIGEQASVCAKLIEKNGDGEQCASMLVLLSFVLENLSEIGMDILPHENATEEAE